jgi:hypothetical protein
LLHQKDWVAWKTYSVLKTVDLGEFAFREQLRFGLQPVTRFVPLRRTLVHITEAAPNAPKWFAAQLTADKDWLHKATKEISKYWRQKRARHQNPEPSLRL